jgi:SulP family sulfate permease
MEAKLELGTKQGDEEPVVLREGVFVIGRSPNSDLVLGDSQVSWQHARITLFADRGIVEDLNSTNGTFVGSQRVSRRILRNKDTLTIGPYRLSFRITDKTPSPSTASEQTLFPAIARFFGTGELRGAASTRLKGVEGRLLRRIVSAARTISPSKILLDALPFLVWARAYRLQYLRSDLSAGVTVAAMIIPQGMAYAMLAGLPPVMGLYAAMLPLVLYAFAGTSRQLSVGPDSLDSLLVAVGVGTLAQAGTDTYIAFAILLALSIGVIQVLMGIVRLGFLVNFLSYPVMCGFTTAAAVITALSQFKHLLGISLPQTFDLKELVLAIFSYSGEVNPIALGIGVIGILMMLGLRRWMPRLPGPFIVIVLATVTVGLFSLDNHGVKIVGAVPAGLPEFSLPSVDWPAIQSLLPLAITMALVDFTKSISVAKSLANKQGGAHVDANQELIGLGLANMGSSISQGYSVTGGLSRSAVNARAGARTPLAGVFTALLVGLTLLYFTPLIYNLPKAALAGIIMVAAVGLIDVREFRYLFRVKRSEGALLVFTCVATLTLGIKLGLLVGVIASILLFITLNTRPHAAILGRLPETDIFRNAEEFREAQTIGGLIILRIDASFYFANTEFLKAKIRELLQSHGDTLQALILDASAINDLDSSADTALHQIAADFKKRGIEFYIAGVKGPVRKVMKRSGLYDVLGGDHFFFTIDAAVKRIQRELKG